VHMRPDPPGRCGVAHGFVDAVWGAKVGMLDSARHPLHSRCAGVHGAPEGPQGAPGCSALCLVVLQGRVAMAFAVESSV
jgi:hypothetical protein